MRISLGGGQAPAPLAGTQAASSFVPPPPTDNALLMETSGYLLLEDGSKILTE